MLKLTNNKKVFYGNIYNINASNITLGVLKTDNGGTGLSTTPTNGQIDIGNLTFIDIANFYNFSYIFI